MIKIFERLKCNEKNDSGWSFEHSIDSSGVACSSYYFRDKKSKQVERSDGPSRVDFDSIIIGGEECSTLTVSWNKNGKCHREDGPALYQVRGIFSFDDLSEDILIESVVQ